MKVYTISELSFVEYTGTLKIMLVGIKPEDIISITYSTERNHAGITSHYGVIITK